MTDQSSLDMSLRASLRAASGLLNGSIASFGATEEVAESGGAGVDFREELPATEIKYYTNVRSNTTH